MKTLITHLRPHLDDICAFWLLKRYLPEAKDAALDFIATNEKGGNVINDPDLVYVGVGRGKYDEHKGDIGDCATTLVWKDIGPKAAIDARERRAVEKIVAWVFLEDTGKLNAEPYRFFSVPAMIEGYFDSRGRDSKTVTQFCFDMLDAMIVAQRNEVLIEDDWKKRIEFDSRYGRAVAVVGTARQIDAFGYSHGFPLVAIVNPDRTYHTIRADAASDIDLTPTWEKIRAAEPEASWYFHHSKKMLICGGDDAPGARLSSLTMEELIALLK